MKTKKTGKKWVDPNEKLVGDIREYLSKRFRKDKKYFAKIVADVLEVSQKHGVRIYKDDGPVWESSWILVMRYLESEMTYLLFESAMREALKIHRLAPCPDVCVSKKTGGRKK